MRMQQHDQVHGWRRQVAAASLLVLALGAAACGDQPAGSGGSSPPQPTPTAATPAPTASTPASPTSPVTPPARRTAADQLRDFFAAARDADTALHRAARLINEGVTEDAVTVRPATVAAVKAVPLEAVYRAVPAGLDRELLRGVLLVYSDIVSRRMAMGPVTYAGGDAVVVLPRPGRQDTSPSAWEILTGLGDGHAAAARFEGDLAAVRSTAARTPAFTVRSDTSRAAAEVAVRVTHIAAANGGCGGTGGQVFPRLVPMTWKSGSDGHWTGTVDGIGFDATHQGDSWRVRIDAC